MKDKLLPSILAIALSVGCGNSFTENSQQKSGAVISSMAVMDTMGNISIARELAAVNEPINSHGLTQSDISVYLDVISDYSTASSWLFDFDGDGKEELIVDDLIENFTYGVWSGSECLKIPERGDSGTEYIYIHAKNGKFYLDLRGDWESGSRGRYYTVENGQWVIALTYQEITDIPTDKTTFTLNDQIVSEAEYYETLNSFEMIVDCLISDHHSVRDELTAIATNSQVAALTENKAIEMFEIFEKGLPRTDKFGKYAGYFYMDFDRNNIPEMVVSYVDGEWAGAISVYYIASSNGRLSVRQCRFETYPENYSEEHLSLYYNEFYVADRLFCSGPGNGAGVHGGVGQFPDGSYGLWSETYGKDAVENWEELGMDFWWDSYSGNCYLEYDGAGRFEHTGKECANIYTIQQMPHTVPATFSYYRKPVAYPSVQTVSIDGVSTVFQMYALKDAAGNPTNYIKVRDLANALSGTQAAFAVTYNGVVNLVTGTQYTPNGSENHTPFSGEREYQDLTAITNVNGYPASLGGIILTDDNGGGYTYYKLRDLGKALGFHVSWSENQGVYIETGKPYQE